MNEELQQLKTELENVKEAIFMKQMSDNFCYTNGTIYPLLNKEKDITKQIAELEEKENEDE